MPAHPGNIRLQLMSTHPACAYDPEAVFDLKGGGTGFLGITSKHVIFQDNNFLQRMKAMVSIPYDRIHTIAAEHDAGWLSGGGSSPKAR